MSKRSRYTRKPTPARQRARILQVEKRRRLIARSLQMDQFQRSQQKKLTRSAVKKGLVSKPKAKRVARSLKNTPPLEVRQIIGPKVLAPKAHYLEPKKVRRCVQRPDSVAAGRARAGSGAKTNTNKQERLFVKWCD